MMRSYFAALLGTLLLMATIDAAAGARQQLDAFSTDLQTLQADFRQTVTSSDGRVQDSSEGQVWLSRPNRFRWSYGGDFPELVVADGTTIWIYDEALEQVTVRDQSQAAVDSPLVLLTNPDLLDEKFEIREVGETEQLQLLELVARDIEMEFERLLLGLEDDSLKLLIMEDAFGLRTEILFSNLQRNVPVDSVLFKFEPPEGTDVVGDLPVEP